MKKVLLLLSIALSSSMLHAQAQNLPYISTPTMIPQSPTSLDIIKIITEVTTPNQGIMVDPPSFSVSQNPKEINIKGCYTNGMLTALKVYIDTFLVGPLPAGTYAVKHKAYLSSAQQWCNPTDSNMVMLNLTVSQANLTSINVESALKTIQVFPNPAKNTIHFTDHTFSVAEIISYDGRILKKESITMNAEVDVHDLPAGLYFIRLADGERSKTVKFVKGN